jgi:hypothetical protein
MKPLLFSVSVVVALAVGLVMTRPASAHHAFAAEYDAKKFVTMKGTVTKMEWVNPHAWLYIDVKEPNGTVVNWAVEFSNPNQLLHRGWRKTDLPVGAEVTVEAYLARNGSKTVNAANIILANGKELFAGSANGAPERPGPR